MCLCAENHTVLPHVCDQIQPKASSGNMFRKQLFIYHAFSYFMTFEAKERKPPAAKGIITYSPHEDPPRVITVG